MNGQPATPSSSPPDLRPSAESETTATVGEELAALRAILEGTAHSTGEEFLRNLVRHLAEAIDVGHAFVAEFVDQTARTRVRTLAFWSKGRIQENIEWDLAGTPCEDVVRGGLCHYPAGVSQQFPEDLGLVEMGIESYLGVPLLDADGNVLGHLAVCDGRPMPAQPRRLYVFRIFAARAAAELQRLRVESRLIDSERRFRDLYEEAPIGYLSTGADGRLRSVNRRVTEWLGRPAAELVGTRTLDLVADTQVSRGRAEEAFRRFLAGEEIRGTEVEIRRRDGRPLWVSVWVKPICGADGKVQAGRSIWVDITDRVPAEAESTRLRQQNLYLQEEIKSLQNFEEIVGRSPALNAVLDSVRQVAPTDASVLISGETGTGKELIARAIHSNSKRRDRPLIKINCAALPTGLVESELFGHEKGAFTGAIARRVGRFELAHGGTIFLDEVGEIPAEAQAKLLRVLQEWEFDRVGGGAPLKADVRVIAATNRDLLTAVRAQSFREDLYYRLNVFPIRLPPLRERPDDIPLLVHFLVNKIAAGIGKHLEGVSGATMERLLAYPWPGNVRELENILERAIILARGPLLEIDPAVLPTPPRPAAAAPQASLEAVERDHILAVLGQTDGVIAGPRGAARILGLHANTLRSRMKKLGIHRTSHEMS
jgi:formate hydrogenlyase transcriptional activator